MDITLDKFVTKGLEREVIEVLKVNKAYNLMQKRPQRDVERYASFLAPKGFFDGIAYRFDSDRRIVHQAAESVLSNRKIDEMYGTAKS